MEIRYYKWWQSRKLFSLILLGCFLYMLTPVRSNETNSIYSNLDRNHNSLAHNAEIESWFREYDVVRKESKSSLREKFQARKLAAWFLNPFGFDIEESREIIYKIIERYGRARDDMQKLPVLNETEELRVGFMNFFTKARQLFIDTLEISKKGDGDKIAQIRSIAERRRELEELDRKNKALDNQLRHQYHILPFRG